MAAHHAVQGFKLLPPSNLKTFFYTGNKLPSMAAPTVMHFGMGKSAAAHMIWDCSTAYRKHGYKFYYTSERLSDGDAAREARSGKAGAEVCLQLVENPEQLPWNYTFVKDAGYQDFSVVDMESARLG